MKKLFNICCVCVLFLGPFAGAVAQVASPESREEFLASARSLVEPEVPSLETLIEGGVAHPFHPRMEEVTEDVVGRLADIAQRLSPDGTITMRGRRFLLLEGRPVGAGEYLVVEYEGRAYEVLVVEITASSFTLRLNDEELERNL